MARAVGLSLLGLSLLTLGLTGCGRSADPAEVDLVLMLPESVEPPTHAPERVAKLTIDGKDLTGPRGSRREAKVKPAAGRDAVTVELSYWPNTYTNVIRTRVVPVERGKRAEVDLTREDPQSPDQIKPIYFPTPTAVVEEMCKLGRVGKDEVVYDIGCGDGRLVIRAVKQFGAKKGVGMDIREYLVKQSRENAKKEGVEDRVEFRQEDALKIKDLSEATVVLLYLGEDLNLKLRPVLQKTLKPGARVVSHRFRMGDWKPDETRTITAQNNYGKDEEYELHLWTVK